MREKIYHTYTMFQIKLPSTIPALLSFCSPQFHVSFLPLCRGALDEQQQQVGVRSLSGC